MVVAQVQALCAIGLGVVTAWRAAIKQSGVQRKLRRYVERAQTLAPSFYHIARAVRRPGAVVRGKGFVLVVTEEHGA